MKQQRLDYLNQILEDLPSLDIVLTFIKMGILSPQCRVYHLEVATRTLPLGHRS